ncbi:MAG TPA: sarcosine oxidase subunit gamma family protein [Dongiaceae bacterium]
MLERPSALAAVLRQAGRSGSDGSRALRLGEVRGWNLVQVAAFTSTAAELERVVSAALGVASLPTIGKTGEAGARRIFRTGPEQFWVTAPSADNLATRLQEVVPATMGAVTSLSHSRTRIFIEGEPAREVLARSIPLDFHPAAFAIGQFALTGIHHTPVLIHRAAEQRYEIYAMRTFALSVWEWLTDAALPFGYQIEGSA